jgi:DNA-directed RNA polymerase specialized sigma24 family protein
MPGPEEIADGASDAEVIASSLLFSDAFGILFERHFDEIHRYLARRVGRERANDLASQTFVVAFERRGAFRPDVLTALPWLLGIATRLLLNERRSATSTTSGRSTRIRTRRRGSRSGGSRR